MPAEAGTRSAVPWGVVGLACGTVEPEICVIKVLRFYLAFVGGPSRCDDAVQAVARGVADELLLTRYCGA